MILRQIRRDLRFKITGVLVVAIVLAATGSVVGIWTAIQRIPNDIEALQDTYSRVIERHVDEHGLEDYKLHVRETAKQVAEKVEEYLFATYPHPNSVANKVLSGDDALWSKLECSSENRNGRYKDYAALFASDYVTLLHPRFRNENPRSSAREGQLLSWWKIYDDAARGVFHPTDRGRFREGYYLWREGDGAETDEMTLKYMACTPVLGTRYIVAVTSYLDEDLQTDVVATANDISKVFSELDKHLTRQVQLGALSAVVVTLVASFFSFLFIGKDLGRLAAESNRVERYWRIAGPAAMGRELWHGVKNDVCAMGLVFKQTASALQCARARVALPEELYQEPELVDDFLGLGARIDRLSRRIRNHAGSVESHHTVETFDFGPWIEEFVKREAASYPTLSVSCNIRGGPHRIRGVVRDLEEVFRNLLLNSAQAQGDGPAEVNIRVARFRRFGEKWLRVVVKDNGPGFADPDQAMKPGWTTRCDSGGTGLGLTTVERIILEHRGDVILRNSDEPGCGAEVLVELPL